MNPINPVDFVTYGTAAQLLLLCLRGILWVTAAVSAQAEGLAYLTDIVMQAATAIVLMFAVLIIGVLLSSAYQYHLSCRLSSKTVVERRTIRSGPEIEELARLVGIEWELLATSAEWDIFLARLDRQRRWQRLKGWPKWRPKRFWPDQYTSWLDSKYLFGAVVALPLLALIICMEVCEGWGALRRKLKRQHRMLPS